MELLSRANAAFVSPSIDWAVSQAGGAALDQADKDMYVQATSAGVLGVALLICLPKLLLFARGTIFLLLSNEKKGMSKAPDTGKLRPAAGRKGFKSKTVVFIRHGESEWNQIFNKSKVLLLPRLLLGIVREALKLPVATDSLFLDSPLSSVGVDQALEMRRAIETYQRRGAFPDDVVACLRRCSPKEVTMVCSNLRRCQQTGLIGLWPQLESSGQQLKVLASLQEMSRNVDTNALAGANALPKLPRLKTVLKGGKRSPKDALDPSECTGNKALFSRGITRMNAFAKHCLDQPEDVVVVGSGHSLWFKNFFK